VKTVIFIGTFFILIGWAVSSPYIQDAPKAGNEYYFPSVSDEFKKAKAECIEQKKFPCNFPEPNDSLSDFVNEWYSKHLSTLKESILYTQTNKELKIIRFTHLGTWSSPYSCKIENNAGAITGTYSKTNGRGGYETGHRVKHEQKELNQEKWNQIIAKIDSVDYWNIQTHDSNLVLDGAEWILEVLIDDKYHFVTRNSPDAYEGKEYAELCELVMGVFEE
jgi:hypothetical protein